MILAPETVIGGRYKLKEELAKGGMGAVWVARHLQLDVDVAIKFMDPATVSSPIARARFEREAKALARLQHPHIVNVQDFGFEEDTPYLAMELLRGESLEDRLKRERRLSLQAIATILVQVAKGLRRAHDAGFVHRDLKPGNIFISRSEDEDIVKILDFGIAKQTGAVIDGTATKMGELVGSPHYMSPEQIRSAKDIDSRSDLWSLGIIAYRAITGDFPFQGDTLSDVMANIFTAPVPRASQRARGLPDGVDEFFFKALAGDRDQRFQTVREMTETFARLAGSEEQGAPSWNHDSSASWQVQRPSFVQRTGGGAPAEADSAAPLSGEWHATPMPPDTSRSSGGTGTGTGSGQRASSLDLPMMSAGTLTVSPSTDQSVSSVRREPWEIPREKALGGRRIAIVSLLAASAVALVLVIALRSRSVTSSAPTEAPASGETAAAVDGPSGLAPAVSGPGDSVGAAKVPAESAGSGELAEGSLEDASDPQAIEGEAAPAESAASAPRVAGALIPKGKARLNISSKGGKCKLTVNAAPAGQTPQKTLVRPGTARIYCQWPSGSIRSQEVKAVEGKTTRVVFEPR